MFLATLLYGFIAVELLDCKKTFLLHRAPPAAARVSTDRLGQAASNCNAIAWACKRATCRGLLCISRWVNTWLAEQVSGPGVTNAVTPSQRTCELRSLRFRWDWARNALFYQLPVITWDSLESRTPIGSGSYAPIVQAVARVVDEDGDSIGVAFELVGDGRSLLDVVSVAWAMCWRRRCH
ncbi:hypothetical protein WJX81_000638 [Elliptochloris bilobata]|uniref:Uncharacterized protein n=1 Tax=Elliptochloris bilobata TaxID=381761 RepID=A0AAW1SBF2_9CHLO